MCKVTRKFRKGFGRIIIWVGAGIILTVVVPIWGWIAVGGVSLIYLGIYMSRH
ncbi:hypothetical protein [Clostridium oryzae]|uniref:hypothetical protein n=1 Tax=Clostridium oryzae TaxID=1450648 RepID=UPI001473B7DD|nr:hypothetical protein [Clostridium oryzae]